MLLLDLDINQINLVDVQTFFLHESTDEQTEKYCRDNHDLFLQLSFLLIVLLIVIDAYVIDQNNV
jgi:hypothetical protein